MPKSFENPGDFRDATVYQGSTINNYYAGVAGEVVEQQRLQAAETVLSDLAPACTSADVWTGSF
jgi:hypothetical protein